MSATTASIVARLGMDSGEYKKDLASVVKENERAQKKMAEDAERAAKKTADAQKRAAEEQKAAIRGAASELAGALGVSVSIGGAISAGKAILDFAGNLVDASDAMGIGVEALQELQGAFVQSGASAEVVNKSFAKLSENLSDARKGDNEKLIASFARLGVTWEDIHRLAPDEILMKIADSASIAHDPAERLADIVDVMGKGGVRMAAGLNQGREALEKLRASIPKLSKEDADLLDRAGDTIAQLKQDALVIGSKGILGKAPTWLKELAPLTKLIEAYRSANPPDFEKGYKPPPDPTAPGAEDQSKPKAAPLSPQEAKEKAARANKLAADVAAQKTFADRVKEQNAQREEIARRDIAKTIETAQELYDKGTKDRSDREEKSREDAHKAELARIAKEASARDKAQTAAAEAKSEADADRLARKVQDIKDPHGKAGRRKGERREESILRRAKREIELEDERGGKSAADIAKENEPSLEDRLKPKLGGDGKGKFPRGRPESRDPNFIRSQRGVEAREGLAKGRAGAVGRADDLKSALSTVEQHLSDIKSNLKPASL